VPVLNWRPGRSHAGVGAGIAPTLATPSGSHSFLLQVKTDPLGLPIAVVGDILRMKAVTPAGSVLDNWLKVTGRDTTPVGYTNYQVARQSGTAGVFPAGTAVVNYGQAGQGFLFLTSDDSDGPFYSVRTHAGAPWSVQTEMGRFGNLKNSFGVGASNKYGFAAGDFAGGNYLLYNPTDGFVIKVGGNNVTIGVGGIAITADTSAPTTGTPTRSFHFLNTTGASTFGMIYGIDGASTDSVVVETDALAGKSAFAGLTAAAPTGAGLVGLAEIQSTTVDGGGLLLDMWAKAAGTGYVQIYPPGGLTFSGLLLGGAGGALPTAMLDVRGGISAGTGVAAASGEILTSLAGTWTPTFVGSTIAGTFTYSAQLGRYVKLGGFVFFYGHITISAISVAPTGIMSIGGLPFTSAADTNLQGSVTFGMISNFKYTAASLALTGFIGNSGTSITLRESFTNAATVDVPAANFTNAACNLIFSGFYRY